MTELDLDNLAEMACIQYAIQDQVERSVRDKMIDKHMLANWIRKVIADEIGATKKEILDEVAILIARRNAPRSRKPRIDGFEEVWKLLARGGRDAAERAYVKAIENGATQEQITSSIEAHKKCEWKGRPLDKIPHLSTFLNQGYHKTEVVPNPIKVTPVLPTCKCGRVLNSGEKQVGICLACEYKAKIEKERKDQ